MYDSWARERRRQIEEQEALAAQLLRQVSILQLTVTLESLPFLTLFPICIKMRCLTTFCCDANQLTLILNLKITNQQAWTFCGKAAKMV